MPPGPVQRAAIRHLATFGGLAAAGTGYVPAGFAGATTAPAGPDSARGDALLAAHFPAASAGPAGVVLRFPAPAWADPAPMARAERRLTGIPQFTSLADPLNVNGVTLTPQLLAALHARYRPGRGPPVPPAGRGIRRAARAAYRSESQFISADGRTVLFSAGLTVTGQESCDMEHTSTLDSRSGRGSCMTEEAGAPAGCAEPASPAGRPPPAAYAPGSVR